MRYCVWPFLLPYPPYTVAPEAASGASSSSLCSAVIVGRLLYWRVLTLRQYQKNETVGVYDGLHLHAAGVRLLHAASLHAAGCSHGPCSMLYPTEDPGRPRAGPF